MVDKIPAQRLPEYFKDFHETKPSLVMGLTILSLGFYIINWIYLRNKDFEQLDDDAPLATRGAILLMVLPFSWFFILQILKNLIFSPNNLIIGIIEIVGFGIILFLILKYLFDFCNTFGKITKTTGLIWFIPFFVGLIGLIALVFNFIYLIPLLFFLFIVTPAMQGELNKTFHRIDMKKADNRFYN